MQTAVRTLRTVLFFLGCRLGGPSTEYGEFCSVVGDSIGSLPTSNFKEFDFGSVINLVRSFRPTLITETITTTTRLPLLLTAFTILLLAVLPALRSSVLSRSSAQNAKETRRKVDGLGEFVSRDGNVGWDGDDSQQVSHSGLLAFEHYRFMAVRAILVGGVVVACVKGEKGDLDGVLTLLRSVSLAQSRSAK